MERGLGLLSLGYVDAYPDDTDWLSGPIAKDQAPGQNPAQLLVIPAHDSEIELEFVGIVRERSRDHLAQPGLIVMVNCRSPRIVKAIEVLEAVHRQGRGRQMYF